VNERGELGTTPVTVHVGHDGIHMRCRRRDLRMAVTGRCVHYHMAHVFTGSVNVREVTALCRRLPVRMHGDTSADSHVAGRQAGGPLGDGMPSMWAAEVGVMRHLDAVPAS